MEKTFLEHYITKRIENYVAPTRKGVAFVKGKKVAGLLKPKFGAALFCALLNLSKKKIAEKLEGISFDVLRKFCSEQPFKNVIENIQNDFAFSLVDHIRNRADVQLQLTQKYIESFGEKIFGHSIAVNPPSILTLKEFRDAKQYHKGAIDNIVRFLELEKFKLTTEKGDDMKPWILLQIDRFVIEVLIPYFSKNEKEYKEKLENIRKERESFLPRDVVYNYANMKLK